MEDGTILRCCFIAWILLMLCVGLDILYIKPLAAEDANHFCKLQGYDSYDDFQRTGLFSTKAIAVRCKYVPNYQQMDIDIKQTYAGGLDKIIK
ncbi:unnamed protein product [marine sediment metagenome]|uniref:Uncharacterized protein n=1 Tax=marine sediment metagenome TaxID=412755 RepID=X0TJB5_9ZZZZ